MKKIALTSEQDFNRLVDSVLLMSRADHSRLYFSDSFNMTTRFANNEIIQNVAIHRPRLLIEAAFGRQVGRTTSDKLDARSLKASVERAEGIARLSPDNPEYMEPLPEQHYARFKTYSKTTGSREPRHLAEQVDAVVRRCSGHGCVGAGIISASRHHVGVATSNGLRGFESRTRSGFSLTATLPDSTGWTMNTHRKIYKLDVEDRADSAIDKASQSAGPIEIPPGRYDVILEPAAVAGLVGPMISNLSARDYFKGNSPYSGLLNQRILDPRLQLVSVPDHDDLLGWRFDSQGLPYRSTTWFGDGTLEQLIFDRFTAREQQQQPTPYPRAIQFGLKQPTATSVGQLIRDMRKGILVTNLWYIRYVNPADLTLTGMTRDGTFLIENGEVVGGIKNFRFHESPLRVFREIAGATLPTEAVTNERSKMLAPYLKLNDFNFTSVTRF